MRNLVLFGFLLIILINSACREIYNPQIDLAEKALVVVGIITDEPGIQTIRITYATPFNKNVFYLDKGAKVYVLDNLGTRFDFSEASPGVYESNPVIFKPQYGKSYTLFIETGTGKYYKSSSQTLYSKPKIDSVSSSVQNKVFPVEIDHKTNFPSFRGLKFITELDLTNDKSPYYRFSNTLLAEYKTVYKTRWPEDTLVKKKSLSPPNYCWMKFQAFEFFNLNDRQYNTSSKSQHVLGFCPIDTGFYKIVDGFFTVGYPPDTIWVLKDLHSYTISFKQYHLNYDIYKYYEQVNQQLASKQRIFDPISMQCIGNMTCQNNPNEVVLGIFEVSSFSVITYMFNSSFFDKYLNFRRVPTMDIDKIPEPNCLIDQVPDFWTPD